jgi:DNA repair protein RadC
MPTARNETPPEYGPVKEAGRKALDDSIIAQALAILTKRIAQGPVMDSPQRVKDYLTARAAGLEREVFAVMFLDNQHRLIETHDMFFGTISQTSVYPREVVKRALELNAVAVVFTHNHPSGMAEPSRADEHLTAQLKSALALVDVRVLDHIITAGGTAVSMAERGLV